MAKNKLFTKEILEFVKKECYGLNSYQTRDKVNDHFKTDYSQPQIAGMRQRYNIPSGCDTRFQKGGISWNKGKKMDPNPNCIATQFKKGHVSHNHKPIGTISLRYHKKNGYVYYIKVFEGKWELLNRYVWEKETGEKLQSKEIITFKDGNTLNCDISNLEKITKKQNSILNKCKLRTNNPELFETSIQATNLVMKVNDIKRKRHKK